MPTIPAMPRIENPYPSRCHPEPIWIDRDDPVLHDRRGTETPGPLSPEQLARFRRDGFLYIPDLFGVREIESYREELDELCQRSADDPDDRACIREPDTDEVRSVFEIHQRSFIFGRLAGDQRLAGAARQILADDVAVHQSRVNRKPGFRGRGFAWHSDFETWHVEDGMPRMRALSASLSLTDNLPYNGSLMLVPGSHRTFVGCVGETPADNYRSSLRRQTVGVPDERSIARLAERGGGIAMPTGSAGGLLLFDCNVLHASADNLTPYPRSNVFFVYNACSNRLCDPFGGGVPRPGFLADRDQRPVKGLPTD